MSARDESPNGSDDDRAILRGKVVWADSMRMEVLSWMIKDLVPAGKITVLAGRGGEGKSTLAYRWAADATRGGLNGDWSGPRNVLILAYEDDWATDIKPRLMVAGADVSKVGRFDIETVIGTETIDDVIPMDFSKHAHLLQQEITDKDVSLVIIDPASAAMNGDPNSLKDVRAFIAYGAL